MFILNLFALFRFCLICFFIYIFFLRLFFFIFYIYFYSFYFILFIISFQQIGKIARLIAEKHKEILKVRAGSKAIQSETGLAAAQPIKSIGSTSQYLPPPSSG